MPMEKKIVLLLAGVNAHIFISNTAPHQSRKKRELTRAVEHLKLNNGGGIVPHRLLPAPLTLLANVIASVPTS